MQMLDHSNKNTVVRSPSDHIRAETLRRVQHFLSDPSLSVYPDLKGMCERVSDSYRDRVIIELLQNAHDAQPSSPCAVSSTREAAIKSGDPAERTNARHDGERALRAIRDKRLKCSDPWSAGARMTNTRSTGKSSAASKSMGFFNHPRRNYSASTVAGFRTAVSRKSVYETWGHSRVRSHLSCVLLATVLAIARAVAPRSRSGVRVRPVARLRPLVANT